MAVISRPVPPRSERPSAPRRRSPARAASTGDRAAGFQFGTGFDGLQPVKVTLVGTGKLKDNVFPISTLQEDAAAKLTAAVTKKAGAAFEIQSMTLGLSPVTGEVHWTVTGEGDGR